LTFEQANFFNPLKEVYARQITESKAKLVLVDSDTAPLIKTAISCLDWETQLLYVGPKEVENAIGYETLISDEDSSGDQKFFVRIENISPLKILFETV